MCAVAPLENSPQMESWSAEEVHRGLREIGEQENVADVFQVEDLRNTSVATMSNTTSVEEEIEPLSKTTKTEKRLCATSDALSVHNRQQKDGLLDLLTKPRASIDCVAAESSFEDNFEIPSSFVSANSEASAITNLDSIVTNKENDFSLSLPPSEKLRQFDTPDDVTFSYKRDTKLTCIESRPGGDLLLPLHRLVMVDLTNKEGLLIFIRESVKFVSACLNERVNGTIHFGIQPDTANKTHFGGTILGTRLRSDRKEYEEIFLKAIKNCFYEDQVDCIQTCVRFPVKFIKVVPTDGDSQFVIEIDIVAKYACCKEFAFFVKLPTKERGAYEDKNLYRLKDGELRALAAEEVAMFMADKGKLAQQRQEQEQKEANLPTIVNIDVDKDLLSKFVHLLCDDEENFRGDHYPILVVSAPDANMSDEWMRENLTFLCDIEWKAVFDFDADARVCKFMQSQEKMIKIVMSDEFNERSYLYESNPERFQQLQDDIRSSIHPAWIFVNGYSVNSKEPKLKPVQWKTNKLRGFKDAVKFFHDEIPWGRATIVFLLFSDDTSVMVEATEEFLTCFPKHWMCVAEVEGFGKPWIEELTRRNCVEADSVYDRVVMGIPWNRLNDTVGQIQNRKVKVECELPVSTGATVRLKPMVKNEMFDLDILGCTECEVENSLRNPDQRDEFSAKAENEFYRGESASWWNFFNKNQVCKREIYEELMKLVQHDLVTKCDDCLIEKVCIYHQPGAGGTTSAKHVLWSLRKFYRVALVRNITEHQTAEQIIRLYQYEDSKPRPVLLLLDNSDEEKANAMLSELDERAKTLKKREEIPCYPVCVFLICLRRTKLPKTSENKGKKEPKRVILKHELSDDEKKWFDNKSKALKNQFDRQDPRFVNPRLLISFNIMKESFNKDYIKRMVKDFVDDITDADERRLLKYMSLVNAFDLERRPLPSAAFDSMMVKLPWLRGPRYGRKAISNRWENKLSDAIRVLMNETSKPAMGYIHSMRITNPLLSHEILNYLIVSNCKKVEAISDIALEFLNCTDIFGVKSVARDNLLHIMRDVLKQRGRLPSGLPETFFSPLIQFIFDEESVDKASAVLTKGFSLSNDPFIAQQIARLFIKSQNWEQAVKFAQLATDLKPDSSYLWDTFGRIYDQQLLEECTKLVSANRDIPVHELIPVIELGLKGIDIFGKVQAISDEEKTSAYNNAGYFGELQMIACLLKCLSQADCFQDINSLKKFLLDASYVPGSLGILTDVNGRDFIKDLKTLSEKVDKATNRIEDELFQLRPDIVIDSKRKHRRYAEESLVRLKEDLCMFFGEDSDNPPVSLPERDQCHYRRRRIFRLAGPNMRSLFDLRWAPSGIETLERIFDLVHENIQTAHAGASEYMTMITTNLALTSISTKYSDKIKFDDMVDWSIKLYEKRASMQVTHLEPFLFLTMFNWPRENRLTKSSITTKRIEIALKQWKEAYYDKYPRQRDDVGGRHYRLKDTTLFFLASGSDMASIYTMCEERGMREVHENVSYWRKPETLRTLKRFKGVLSRGGTDVCVQLKDKMGNNSSINIPTSLPFYNRTWWNLEVYFVIGFSWTGPKAFNVAREDPTLEADMSEDRQVEKPNEMVPGAVYRNRSSNFIKQEQKVNRQLTKCKQELAAIQEKINGSLPEEEKCHQRVRERECQKEIDSLLDQWKKFMDSRIPDLS